MNEAIVTTLWFMGSYTGLVLMFFFGMQFLTKGFIGKYLKVKASKGKKILVFVISPTDLYFAIGQFNGKRFDYVTRNKEEKTFSDIPEGAVFPIMGIFAIRVNEKTDLIYTREDVGVSGADPVATSAIIKRIMMIPPSESKLLVAVLLVTLFNTLAIIGLAMYVSGMPETVSQTVIAALKTAVGTI